MKEALEALSRALAQHDAGTQAAHPPLEITLVNDEAFERVFNETPRPIDRPTRNTVQFSNAEAALLTTILSHARAECVQQMRQAKWLGRVADRAVADVALIDSMRRKLQG